MLKSFEENKKSTFFVLGSTFLLSFWLRASCSQFQNDLHLQGIQALPLNSSILSLLYPLIPFTLRSGGALSGAILGFFSSFGLLSLVNTTKIAFQLQKKSREDIQVEQMTGVVLHYRYRRSLAACQLLCSCFTAACALALFNNADHRGENSVVISLLALSGSGVGSLFFSSIRRCLNFLFPDQEAEYQSLIETRSALVGSLNFLKGSNSTFNDETGKSNQAAGLKNP